MIMAKLGRIDNCIRLKWIGISVGITGILGIKTPYLANSHVKIIASFTFGMSSFLVNLIPLHIAGGSKFL